jgi:hypothetical protein
MVAVAGAVGASAVVDPEGMVRRCGSAGIKSAREHD